MRLPFEILQNIYTYLSIDSKLAFHKIFDHSSFKSNRVTFPFSNKNLDYIYQTKWFKFELTKLLFHFTAI